MRIAVFWKRRYMGQDVISDRYARLYELPRGLAELGHEVRVFCLSYRPTIRACAFSVVCRMEQWPISSARSIWPWRR